MKKMTFNEMVLAFNQADATYDDTFEKCVTFLEASYNEYKANLKEAELKVVQESGTPDDLVYLEDKASEGFLVRSAKAIGKLIQSFLAWIKEKVQAIKDFFTSKKTKDALDKAEKVSKENPKLKNEKINITDYKKQLDVCDKYEAQVDKKIAAMNAGKYSSSDKDDLNKIEKGFEDEMKTAKIAVVAVTVAAAVGVAKHLYDISQDKDLEDINPVKGTGDNVENADENEAYTRAVVDKFRLKRERGNVVFNAIKDVVGKAIHRAKGEDYVDPTLEYSEPKKQKKKHTPGYLGGWQGEPDEKVKVNKVKTESILDASIQESYIKEILESLDTPVTESSETDIFPEDITAVESTEDTADTAISEYLESVCSEIFDGKYVEATEEDLNVFDPELELATLESALGIEEDDGTMTAEEYLEALEAEVLGEGETVTAEEYLESLEAEIFGTEDEYVTAEQYLESMEAELFGTEDEPVEESVSDREAYLNGLLKEIESSIE
jgi:hypothetical protein